MTERQTRKWVKTLKYQRKANYLLPKPEINHQSKANFLPLKVNRLKHEMKSKELTFQFESQKFKASKEKNIFHFQSQNVNVIQKHEKEIIQRKSAVISSLPLQPVLLPNCTSLKNILNCLNKPCWLSAAWTLFHLALCTRCLQSDWQSGHHHTAGL